METFFLQAVGGRAIRIATIGLALVAALGGCDTFGYVGGPSIRSDFDTSVEMALVFNDGHERSGTLLAHCPTVVAVSDDRLKDQVSKVKVVKDGKAIFEADIAEFKKMGNGADILAFGPNGVTLERRPKLGGCEARAH